MEVKVQQTGNGGQKQNFLCARKESCIFTLCGICICACVCAHVCMCVCVVSFRRNLSHNTEECFGFLSNINRIHTYIHTHGSL